MWFGVPDGDLSSTVMLPSQFADSWSGSRAVSPGRELALAVLGQALEELVHFRFARRCRDQRLYWEAYQWVASDDRSWPFSFVNLCEAMCLEVAVIRARVLDPAWPSDTAERCFAMRAIPFERAA
jgi:hypothetical protein